MREALDYLVCALLSGAGATVVMDIWIAARKWLFGILLPVNYALIQNNQSILRLAHILNLCAASNKYDLSVLAHRIDTGHAGHNAYLRGGHGGVTVQRTIALALPHTRRRNPVCDPYR